MKKYTSYCDYSFIIMLNDISSSSQFLIKDIQISLTLFKCRSLKLKNEPVLNPYVYIEVGDFTKASTEVFYNTNELTFEGRIFSFTLKLTHSQLKSLKISISLYHKTKWYNIKDELIGFYSIDAFKIYSNANHLLNHEWANLENRKKDAVSDPGFVLFSLMVKGEKDKIVALQQEQITFHDNEDQVMKKLNLNDVVQGKPPVDTTKKYSIVIHVIKAQFIKQFTILNIKQLNPYFTVKYNLNDNLKSSVIGNSIDPMFEEEIYIPMSYPINTNYIVIEFYSDGGIITKNTLISKILLDCDLLEKTGQLESKWYNLYGPERENTLTNQLKTYFVPSFLNNISTMSEIYFYFGRVLISAKVYQDDNPQCFMKHNIGIISTDPEEIEYTLWIDIFQLLQDGGSHLPSDDVLNVEVQLGKLIIEPKMNGKWNNKYKRYEWTHSSSRINEHVIKLPRDYKQIPDMFIRVYTFNVFGKKKYIGYKRFHIETFIHKKNDIKAQNVHLRRCETSCHNDNEHNYLGTLICSINLFIKNNVTNQERPVQIESTHKKKFKLVCIIYMGKNLPLKGNKLPNAYVTVDFNGCKPKSTNAFKESDCPVWSEVLTLTTYLNECLELAPNAKVTVYDKGFITSSEIGSFEVNVSEIKEYVGTHNIEHDLFKLAKWYRLTDGVRVSQGEVLASFFIVKVIKQGKEEIDLKCKNVWPVIEKYNLYLFIIGVRNVMKNIHGCYTEARYNNEGVEEINDNYNNKERFVRYLTLANTNNLNNFDYLGEEGYVTINIYKHAAFIKPLSIVVKNKNIPLYSAVIDISKHISYLTNNNTCNSSNTAITISNDNISNSNNKKHIHNDIVIIPQCDDLIPLYKPIHITPSITKQWEDLFYSTMSTFPLTPHNANISRGNEFIINVRRKTCDIEGKEIKDNEDNTELTRPEIDGEYEDTLKEEQHLIPFNTAELNGNDDETVSTSGHKGIIRFILRLVPTTSSPDKCIQTKQEVDTLAMIFKNYYSTKSHKKTSPEFICRIYIFNASNLSVDNKDITMGYIWTKRYEGDTEYKKSNIQDQFNISLGKVNFYDQIIVIWPETFFLTIALYGCSNSNIFSDELIGETYIDLEKRYFHSDYQMKLNKTSFSQIPIENRTLYKNGVSRGAIRMLVEVFPKSKDVDFPKTNIERNETNVYQLRIVIWNVDNVPTINKGKVDIQITASLQDPNVPEKTDVHYNSTNGHGEFNWRLIFNVEYPSEKHYLQISAEDYHLTGNNQPLASNSYDLEPFLNKIHKNKNAIDIEKHIITLNPHEDVVKKGFSCGGCITLQMKLLTITEAEMYPVGKGRDNPNQDPELFKPNTGRDFLDGLGVTTMFNRLRGIYDNVFKYVKYAFVLVCVGIAAYVIAQLIEVFK